MQNLIRKLTAVVIKLTDKRGRDVLIIKEEESKTEYRKVGPTMSRVRTLAQPPLDGERSGLLHFPRGR